MQTIEIIRERLAARGKEFNRTGIYKHIAALGIKPLGVRQRPQLYPDGTAEKIIIRLGLEAVMPMTLINTADREREDGILTLPEIKRRARKRGNQRKGAKV